MCNCRGRIVRWPIRLEEITRAAVRKAGFAGQGRAATRSKSDLAPNPAWPPHLICGQTSQLMGARNPSRALITFLYMITKIPKLHREFLTWKRFGISGEGREWPSSVALTRVDGFYPITWPQVQPSSSHWPAPQPLGVTMDGASRTKSIRDSWVQRANHIKLLEQKIITLLSEVDGVSEMAFSGCAISSQNIPIRVCRSSCMPSACDDYVQWIYFSRSFDCGWMHINTVILV